jgi:hypothetical protein
LDVLDIVATGGAPGFQAFALASRDSHHVVEGDESSGGNQPPQHCIVAAVHRVLDGVAQDEQQDEIESSQLSGPSLARDPLR